MAKKPKAPSWIYGDTDTFEQGRCEHTGVRYRWSKTHEICAQCGKKVRKRKGP